METRAGGFIRMINLFENFDSDSADFLNSQLTAGIKIPAVAIHDDGFLPDEVDSPIKFYCRFNKKGTPLYFDKLPLPRFWRTTANSRKAEVFDIDKKRAEIHFKSTNNSRWIKEVQWLANDGQVLWSDHYNSSGKKFAKTYFSNGKAVLRKYFNTEGKCVLVYHLLTKDIDLMYENEQRHFNGIVNFLVNYLKQSGYNLDHIFYNTLNIPFFTSLKLSQSGSDTLFWHEKTTGSLPGNMKYLINTKTRTKHIIFQRYDDWKKYQNLFTENKNVDFDFLGQIYPHPRGNKLRLNALIMTNSDQIEQLSEVVKEMSSIHFNIVALTEMSEKLLAFSKYENVDLIPTATDKRIQQLYKDCDIYLDINHGNEICNAVRKAFEQNMLIVGFSNTLHNPRYILKENIFDPGDIVGMKKKIMLALGSIEVMKKQIDTQRKNAGDVSIDDYQRVIGRLQNERTGVESSQ